MHLRKFTLVAATCFGVLSAFGQTVQRTTLYETFTSSTCPPCAPGNAHLEGLFAQPENEGEFVSLKYQMSWPGNGDPYYTTEGGSRRGFYGVSSVPRLLLDGGFNAGPTGLTQGMMDDAYEVPAEMNLNAYYQVDEASQTVTVQVDVNALSEIDGAGGLFLYVVVFEKTTYNNEETNGESEFEHVMKKMLPNAAGTYLGDVEAGSTESFDFSYTFNGDYRLPDDSGDPIDHSTEHSVEEFSDLGVAVWVQKSLTKEVYQATYALNGFASIENEESTEEFGHFSIYPNPTSDLANIVFSANETAGQTTITVMDQAGKVVVTDVATVTADALNTYKLNTSDLANGFYLITIANDEGARTEKLNVHH